MFVYHGSASGPAAAAAWSAEGDQASARFGAAVATAGDVNGDGYSDVIVGAPYYDNGAENEGLAAIYYGSASGLATARGWTNEGSQDNAHLGWVVCAAGDVNGDGYSDVCGGSPDNDRFALALADAGLAFVSQGSPSGPGVNWNYFLQADEAGAHLGFAVAGAGDVNGDGFADVLMGAPDYDNGQVDEGRFYLFFGGGWFPLSSGTAMGPAARQYAADGSAPIGMLGAARETGAFRIRALARSALGDVRAKLEWEVKPVGVLFDRTGVHSSDGWHDTGSAGHTFDEPAALAASGVTYHWRARVRYDPAKSPFLPSSRWFSPAWNGPQEGDVRSVCTLAPPSGAIAIEERKSGGSVVISWTVAGDATSYDVVRGSLGVLLATGGDFTLATDACIEDDTAETSATDAAAPGSGNGFWYLVRGSNCGGGGTYDGGGPAQQGSRDAEIAASMNRCP